jgi:hypothetical protein
VKWIALILLSACSYETENVTTTPQQPVVVPTISCDTLLPADVVAKFLPGRVVEQPSRPRRAHLTAKCVFTKPMSGAVEFRCDQPLDDATVASRLKIELEHGGEGWQRVDGFERGALRYNHSIFNFYDRDTSCQVGLLLREDNNDIQAFAQEIATRLRP